MRACVRVCVCVAGFYVITLYHTQIHSTGLQGSLTANGAIVIIEDNDVVNVSFASGMFTVQEGDGVAMVTIQTDKAAANDLTLRVSALSSFSATGKRTGKGRNLMNWSTTAPLYIRTYLRFMLCASA